MNNNTFNKSNKKPFCKVCQDAGKTESDYTSHYVKSDKGIVICPTLLAVLCRYCNKKGHTIKFCPTLEQNKKEDKKHAFKIQKEETDKVNTNSKKSNKKINNMFASLCDDTSSDEDKKKSNKNIKNNNNGKNKQINNNDDFPMLLSLSKKASVIKPLPLAFKNIIKITQEQEKEKRQAREEAESLKRLNEKKFKKDDIKVMAAPDSVLQEVPKRYSSWACDSSDDEDDEFEEENEYKNPYDSDFD